MSDTYASFLEVGKFGGYRVNHGFALVSSELWLVVTYTDALQKFEVVATSCMPPCWHADRQQPSWEVPTGRPSLVVEETLMLRKLEEGQGWTETPFFKLLDFRLWYVQF